MPRAVGFLHRSPYLFGNREWRTQRTLRLQKPFRDRNGQYFTTVGVPVYCGSRGSGDEKLAGLLAITFEEPFASA